MSTVQLGRFFRRNSAEVGAYTLAAVLFGVAVVKAGGFASTGNINGLLLTATLIGFAALGQTLVVIGGGIDLSVPWLVAVGGLGLTSAAPQSASGVFFVCVGLIALGALIGTIAGLGITFLEVPPIIMTLGVGGLVQGGLLTVQAYGNAGSAETPGKLVDFVDLRLGPIPVITLILLVVAVVVGLLIRRSRFGRTLLATGRNEQVARFAGVHIRLMRTVTYALSGASAVVAGIFAAGYIKQAYVTIGSPYLFTSIAAVAIGGVSLIGGRGTFYGVIGGALVLTLLEAILPMFDLGLAQLQIVYGLVIIIGIGAARILWRLVRNQEEAL